MGEDYVYMFLNSALSKGNALGPLMLLFLFLARFLPIIALTPFFGAKVLPNPVKLTFAISMFVIFLPILLTTNTVPLTFNYYAILLFGKEFLIGFIMGFVASIPFMIVQNVGIIIDHQRGGASLMVNDPTIQNQSSPLGTIFNYVMIYLFFLIDGPFLMIDAVMHSYEIVPPDKFINSNFFAETSSFYDMQAKLFNKMMVISLQMSAPGLLAILMTDVFLGIANRLAPQVQITFLGMPLKSLLGLGVVFLGWKLFAKEMVRQCYYWLNQIDEILVMLKAAAET